MIVTESYANVVSIFDSSGIKINRLGTKGSALEFRDPCGVAVDDDGYILVSDYGNGCITLLEVHY
jgi:DNA-binding beta-propeller fold protein YncE